MAAHTSQRLLRAALLGCCALVFACGGEETPPVHKGYLPAEPGPRVPHIVEGGSPPVPAVAASISRDLPDTGWDLPFGIRVDNPPFGLSEEAAVQGGAAALLLPSAILAGLFAYGFVQGRRTRAEAFDVVGDAASIVEAASLAAPPVTSIKPQPIASQPIAPQPSVAAATPEIGVVLPEAPLPPVVAEPRAVAEASAAASASVVAETPGAPPQPPPAAIAASAELEPREPQHAQNDVPADVELGAHDESPPADDPLTPARQREWRLPNPAAALGRSVSGVSRGIRSVPRHALEEMERRRGPFRDGGEFWAHGIELMRLGVPEEAQRHYWAGYYECAERGWQLEAATALERLAEIALARGDSRAALRHLQEVRRTYETLGASARLDDIGPQLRSLQEVAASRGHDEQHE